MLNKKDHICFCLAMSCRELMQQDKTVYDGETLALRDKFVTLLSMTEMYYKRNIDQGTLKWYKKTVNVIDSEIEVGQGWIPLLLTNEIMGAWLTENSKHLKFWNKWDFSSVYDHLESVPEELEKTMYLKAQRIISRITGEKYDHDKNVRKLRLKAIRLRLEHESK